MPVRDRLKATAHPDTSERLTPHAADPDETRPAQLDDAAAPSRSLEEWRRRCISGLLALASEMMPEEARRLVIEISHDPDLRSRPPQQVAIAAYQLYRQDGEKTDALRPRDVRTRL